jgi:hypothetical protein
MWRRFGGRGWGRGNEFDLAKISQHLPILAPHDFFLYFPALALALAWRPEISLKERPDWSHPTILSATACAPSSLTEHSQTTATFQPSLRKASTFSLSRFIVSPNLDFQNFVLDAGVVQNTQRSCLCQKQPRTSTMAEYLGSTMSGRPGSPGTWRRYRSPLRCSARRKSSSGLVSLPRIPAIILERVILSTTSIIRWRPQMICSKMASAI